jgi:beta-N-acetylhexosaminidase
MTADPGLRRLALGTLLGAFPGAAAPIWALDLLADGLAGYVLFGRNIAGPDQTARLTAQLRAARPTALVAIDEEGGDVTRLDHRTGSGYPGNAALGVVDDPGLTRSVYAAIGADLADAGIGLNLAPAVDVNTADDNPVIGTRSFGADPLLVARHAAAAIAGLQSTGVAACAKHFPGHGATVTDSHRELPTVDVPLDVLRTRELPPFAAAVGAGARAIMTAHVRVPALTGDDPATFSRRALVGLLRGEMGYPGVVITDALEMTAAAAVAGGIPQAAVRALAAGADLLCIGARVSHELVEAVAAEIVTAVADQRLPRLRLVEAATRTAELAAWSATPGTRPDRDAGLGDEAARRAVRVEGAPGDLTSALVIQLTDRRSTGTPWGLAPHVAGAEQLDLAAAEAVASRAGARPVVVAGRNLHRSPESCALIERLAASRDVVVVEMGWPSPWRPAGVRAFLTTFGAGRANGRAAASILGRPGADYGDACDERCR